MENIKVVLFDFDGTIADTLPIHFDLIIETAKKKFSIDKNEAEIIHKIKTQSYGELMKTFKISWLKVPMILGIIKEAQEKLYYSIDKIRVFPGVKNLLKDLKVSGFEVDILSSNIEKTVDKFLQLNRITEFRHNYSGSHILGKAFALDGFLKKHHLRKEDVVYVGDEIRDIEACKKVGIRMIGVSWGLHTKDTLIKNGVDYMVEKPAEILKILEIHK